MKDCRELSVKIQLLIKSKRLKNAFLAFKHSDVVYFMLINVKMPKHVGIFTCMSMMNYMLSWLEHN